MTVGRGGDGNGGKVVRRVQRLVRKLTKDNRPDYAKFETEDFV